MKTLRALLVLGRVSNLPTIWSNCLCGWLIGMSFSGEEQIDWFVFGLLILGATGLYVGGMYLNDACDAVWDRKHRPERPIPAGLIAGKTVWSLGIGMMAGGMFFLCLQGGTTALLALCLFNLIFIYNFAHKGLSWSPLLIAGCRLLLILLARRIRCVYRGAWTGTFCLCNWLKLVGQGGERAGLGAYVAVPVVGSPYRAGGAVE